MLQERLVRQEQELRDQQGVFRSAQQGFFNASNPGGMSGTGRMAPASHSFNRLHERSFHKYPDIKPQRVVSEHRNNIVGIESADPVLASNVSFNVGHQIKYNSIDNKESNGQAEIGGGGTEIHTIDDMFSGPGSANN